MERVHSLYDFLTRNAACIPPDMEAFIKGMLEVRQAVLWHTQNI